MDTFEFVSSLVASLAWPLVIAVIALYFRKGIKAILDRPLRRMKAGPIEAEWEEKAAEAAVDVATSPETSNAPSLPKPVLLERLGPVAEREPGAAVVTAFAEIEQALRMRLIEAGYLDAQRRPIAARQMAQEAVRRELISPQIAEAIDGMTVLRNLAAHGGGMKLDTKAAVSFLDLADAVLHAIRQPEEVASS